MMLATTEERIYWEGVEQGENALCTDGAEEHNLEELMETNAFFIVIVPINAHVSLILLVSSKRLPFRQNLYVFWGKNEKFFKINM